MLLHVSKAAIANSSKTDFGQPRESCRQTTCAANLRKEHVSALTLLWQRLAAEPRSVLPSFQTNTARQMDQRGRKASGSR